jgi:fructokinase
MKRLGIDLGGTKTELVILDAQHQVCWRERLPSARLANTRQPTAEDLEQAYQQTLSIIVSLLQTAEQAHPDIRGVPVGIGTPGSESPQAVLRNCNSIWLNGRSFRQDLEGVLQRPVRLANDANCFALAEATMGAAKGAGSVFGVILGTGVGGGLVFNGALHSGINHIGGEWGHNPLPVVLPESKQQRACYCGRMNCLETFLSGPGLSRSYFLATQQSISADRVMEKVRQGETFAKQVWHEYLQQLACSLAQVINIVDPEVIVLGGGVSNVTLLYEEIPRLWQPYVFSETIQTRLLQAKLGDSAGVFGAAWLWP